MKIWILLSGSVLILAFTIFAFAVAIHLLASQGGGPTNVDLSIYSLEDRSLLKQHLQRLAVFRVITMALPLVSGVSLVLVWIGYVKGWGPAGYWYFLLPVIYAVLLLIVWNGFDTRPSHAFRPQHEMMTRQYFKCEANRRLEGGIYGKGPMQSFGPYFCRGWQEIDEAEFKSLAMKWHGAQLRD